MEAITTHFEVMEDSLGFQLRPATVERVQDIAFEDLNRLANDLANHTKSDYFQVPTAEDVVGFCHPKSRLGRQLGAYSNSTGNVIGGSTESIVGGVYYSLLTHTRLALPDGLQYLLDYYEGGPHKPVKHDHLAVQVKKVLTAFAHLGDLFNDGYLFLLPEAAWGDVHYSVSTDFGTAWHAAMARQLATYPFVKAEAVRPGWERYWHDLAREELGDVSTDEERWRLAAGHAFAGEPLNELRRLLLAAQCFGYTPMLTSPLEQTLFDALVRVTGAKQPAGGAIWSGEDSVLLPQLARLSVAEFTALKHSGDADHVVRALVEIDHKAADYADRPLDLKEFLVTQLDQAGKKLGETVSRSKLLSGAATDFVKFTAGALVVTTAAAQAGRPDLLSDPFKLLVTGGAGVVGGAIASLSKAYAARMRHRPARHIFSKLREDLMSDEETA